MKYTIYVNQAKAIDLGLTNINQAMIFDLLTTASTWAKPTTIDGEIYYWVARQAIVKELPILGLKPDTVYRHLKSIADLGIIDYKKDGKKDCIRVTNKGKSYLSNTMSETNPSAYVGNESELPLNTEMNPSKCGNESENNSEIDPTYPTTITNQATNLSTPPNPQGGKVIAIRVSKSESFKTLFTIYPDHRKGGTDTSAWNAWKSGKLTDHHANLAISWLTQAAKAAPSDWATEANGYAFGITKFIKDRIWLKPIPKGKSGSVDMGWEDKSWAEDLGAIL